MRKLTRLIPIELDGKILIRCYSDQNFVDADLNEDAAYLLLADLAKLLLSMRHRGRDAA